MNVQNSKKSPYSINYVVKFLGIFDLPFVVTFTKSGLYNKMVIWLTPLPLNCPRGLWMTPKPLEHQLEY